MNVAIIGVTGLVGQMFLKILEERNFPIENLIPVASEQSVNKIIKFKNKDYTIVNIKKAIDLKPGLALFSAGSEISLKWAPQFEKAGCRVIDNSSAWRMDPRKKLIVPEINAKTLTSEDYIIANPNCSTIQMLVPLWPLHLKYKIKRIVVSTYQSVTGTGKEAINQMENERTGNVGKMVYPHLIDRNCLPHCDVFTKNGYTKEEMKLMNETQKIFNDTNVMVTATAVRVPVSGGHSEAVNIEFEKDFKLQEIRDILKIAPGVIIKDDPENNVYPMPLYENGKDEVFVGRIRRDFSQPNCLNLWIVADNLRKGAATNAVQIAEYLTKEKYL
ncbi:MAG: aspartate-semialdehyde dehydrogenase [Chlorobi bacterium]|nr:aspartate-semialdehyde dehydrogenase [Chlorobiota bacterium]